MIVPWSSQSLKPRRRPRARPQQRENTRSTRTRRAGGRGIGTGREKRPRRGRARLILLQQHATLSRAQRPSAKSTPKGGTQAPTHACVSPQGPSRVQETANRAVEEGLRACACVVSRYGCSASSELAEQSAVFTGLSPACHLQTRPFRCQEHQLERFAGIRVSRPASQSAICNAMQCVCEQLLGTSRLDGTLRCRRPPAGFSRSSPAPLRWPCNARRRAVLGGDSSRARHL